MRPLTTQYVHRRVHEESNRNSPGGVTHDRAPAPPRRARPCRSPVHCSAAQSAQAQEPLRIGVITFLSGPAAGPFGVPAKNASDLLAEALNKGGAVPGYEKKGFGGRPIELVYVDEAGGPTKVVTEYRNLVERQNVDMVIGVISSRRLPGGGAGGRGTEEVHRPVRLRHQPHLRGSQLQVRVPHHHHGDAGERGGGALHRGELPQSEDLLRHQPELRVGPGRLVRLHRGDEDPQAAGADRHQRDAQAGRRPVRHRDLRPARQRRRDHPELAVGRRSRGLHPAGRAARPAGEDAQHHDHRRDRDRAPGQGAARRHDPRRARPQRPVRAAHDAEQVVRQGLQGQVRHRRRCTPPTTWPPRSSA